MSSRCASSRRYVSSADVTTETTDSPTARESGAGSRTLARCAKNSASSSNAGAIKIIDDQSDRVDAPLTSGSSLRTSSANGGVNGSTQANESSDASPAPGLTTPRSG